jgi:O-antigen/teichoic acid export membrane protein
MYLLIYPAGFMIEYIFLLEKRYNSLVKYAFFSIVITLLVVAMPPFLHLGINYSIYGLCITAVVKFSILFLLLKKYSRFSVNIEIIKELLRTCMPLIGTSLVVGTASYIDGIIVSQKFNPETFAVFRFGAREFPLFLLMTVAFSTSIIPLFSNSEKISENLLLIKNRSRQYIIYFFPLAVGLLFTSQYIFENVFNKNFYESYYIFDIYLLLVISRFVFPSTILTGMRITKVLFFVSIIELIINITSSLILLRFIGYQGVAYGTVIAYFSEKVILILYVKKKLKLDYSSYIPFKELLLFSIALITVFIIKILIFRY